MESFLEGRLAQNDENAPGFPSEPICLTPTVALPLSLQAPSPSCVGHASARVCCQELSFEHSISALELPSLQPTPQHTYMSCMHDLAINTEETMTRLLAAVLSLNKP